MTFDVAAYIREGLRGANWISTDLWIAAVGLGGNLDLGDIRRVMSGEREPTRGEYQVLAHALNERFMDLGQDHPVAYWKDLPAVT